LKELTSRNLELLTKIATVESTCVPMNEEYKAQIAEMEKRLEKAEGYFKSLGTAHD
jgi:hypothetical protein